MRNYKFLILFILLPTLLTGCFEKREVEDLAYVIAIGLDKGQNENISVSFQIAVPIKIAGEGSAGAGKESTSLITLEADSIYNAVSRADTMISKEITLSHNKIIVFSEELAKEGITDYLESLVTNRELRPKTSIIVHKGKAEDFLANLEPVLETNPARYYELVLDSSEYTGYATDNSLFHFYLASRDEFSSPFAMLTESMQDENSSNQTHSQTESQSESQTNGQAESQKNSQQNEKENPNLKTSSHEPTHNENTPTAENNAQSQGEDTSTENNFPKTANIAGIAIFKSGKLVGEIRDEQIISHLMLQSNLKKVNIDVKDIKDSKKTSVIKIVQQGSPNIKVKIQNNKPLIDIIIKLNCQLLTSGSTINYNEKANQEKLEQNIQEKLKKDMSDYLNTITKNFQADPIGFGKYCRVNVSTLEELSRIKWDEIFPSSIFNVKFQLHLDTTQMVSNEQGN